MNRTHPLPFLKELRPAVKLLGIISTTLVADSLVLPIVSLYVQNIRPYSVYLILISPQTVQIIRGHELWYI